MLPFLLCIALSAQARRPAVKQQPDANTFTCDICQVLVQKIEEALKDKQTQEQIAQMVSLYCKIFGEQIRPLCERIATQYIPIIIQLIEQKMEHVMICQKLGLCDEASVTFLPSSIAANAGNCEMCTKIVKTIEDLLKSGLVEKEIAAAIALLCKNFPPPVSTFCSILVNRYVPTIIQWIESGMEKANICKKLGFCDSVDEYIDLKMTANAGNCEMCTKIVKTIEDLLKSGLVEKEIAAAIALLCKNFPPPVSTFCSILVNRYVPTIIQWIESGMEKANICKKLGFCENAIQEYQDNGISCTMCKKVVHEVKHLLLDKKVESEIVEFLTKQCEKFPTPYNALCVSFVQGYIVDIMKLIEQGIDEATICKKFGYCAVKSEYFAEMNAMTCTMCETIISYVEKAMVDTKVESEIIALVKKLCVKFPAPYSTLCDSLVAEFVPKIMQWLEQGLEHIEICKKIGFCPKASAMLARIPQANGVTCDMCNKIVSYVEKAMVDTKVEAEVIALVKKICVKFPAPYSTLCDSLVPQFVPKIMQWLEQGLEHLEICKKIGLCNVVLVPTETDGMACTVCTTIVSYVEKIMVDTKVESEIIALVKKLCVKFPAPYSTLCDSLVAEFVPKIMQWLEQGLEHIEICKKIKLCPQNSVQFLGARIPIEVQNGVSCDVCKGFFEWAKKELGVVTIDGLWKLVHEECPKVPYLKYFCQIINEDNIVTLVNLLLSKFNPVQACEWIKLC